ncbi:hypothetical protein TRFO_17438 [Tritrichomonas foetus]|uniref:Initiator binding domain-containing protein n=1 Tax=Tritrichomonas foetus TaxID=1144522 RepID=A0A1J4KSS5_9EUKA|nr:hypothetical protein TRFO_17438 [Tritrichomonas foetus]|eukprot:OHT12710.1 hypothetical protein TRFO_17438 [Tritrichomonas foetus]
MDAIFPSQGECTNCNLSPADQNEYNKLMNYFENVQNARIREYSHLISFQKEINLILDFVNCRSEGREIRALHVGLAQNENFIGVNSQKLKALMHRCKSSINNSFQQLGYDSIKSRTKANTYLLSILPSIANNSNAGRQWTVRNVYNTGYMHNHYQKKIPFPLLKIEHPKLFLPPQRSPFPVPIIIENHDVFDESQVISKDEENLGLENDLFEVFINEIRPNWDISSFLNDSSSNSLLDSRNMDDFHFLNTF